MLPENSSPPRWIKICLVAAAFSQLLAALALLFELRHGWRMDGPTGAQPVNAIGVWLTLSWGAWGLGYLLAAIDPWKHWGILLTGFLLKLLGPLALISAWFSGESFPAWAVIILLNDGVWLPVLGAMLWTAFRNSQPELAAALSPEENPLETVRSVNGHTLLELSQNQTVMVVFLRHAGCTFCREAVSDLSEDRESLERQGVKIALVHMGDAGRAQALFSRYDMGDVEQFSNPKRKLYQYFDLKLGSFRQLLGPGVWWRGFLAAIIHRHGFAKLEGNGFQMPGVFLMRNGEVLSSYRHRTAASRPDYEQLACSVADEPTKTYNAITPGAGFASSEEGSSAVEGRK